MERNHMPLRQVHSAQASMGLAPFLTPASSAIAGLEQGSNRTTSKHGQHQHQPQPQPQPQSKKLFGPLTAIPSSQDLEPSAPQIAAPRSPVPSQPIPTHVHPPRTVPEASLSGLAASAELPPLLQPEGDSPAVSSVGTHAYNSSASATSANTTILPSLSSVTGGLPSAAAPAYTSTAVYPPQQLQRRVTSHRWPSLNPLTAYYCPSSHVQSSESPQKMDLTTGLSEGRRASSPDRLYCGGRAASVSLDDPDVRMAAEALGDLRADFVSSSPNRNMSSPPSPRSLPQQPQYQPAQQVLLGRQNPQSQPEPLLSLLTTSHPLVATTIDGATSVYNNSKNFSPRFKSSAEYVEGYLSPLANTVNNVGRVTGVEGSVRWFLGAGRRHQSTDFEQGDRKRRRTDFNTTIAGASPDTETRLTDADLYVFEARDRRASMSTVTTVDSLPAYDDFRSPAYADAISAQASSSRSGASPAWTSRVMISTSGLGCAMRDESLRSLKYCLSWLRWGMGNLGKVSLELEKRLEEYERVEKSQNTSPRPKETAESEDENQIMTDAASPLSASTETSSPSTAYAFVSASNDEVISTIRRVVDIVSNYTGGALPDNAGKLVREYLKSLPARFQIARMQHKNRKTRPGEEADAGREATVAKAHKALVLAKEGLHILTQISGVLHGTIVSAEKWCEKPGGRSPAANADVKTAPLTGVAVDGDVKMG